MLIATKLRTFREYNKLDCKLLAERLNIDEDTYKDFESNRAIPTIDQITQLAEIYKITVDEFYGTSPRITLHTPENDFDYDEVSENLLKMSDLSWDEHRLIVYYRTNKNIDKDKIIKMILEETEEDNKE